MKQQVVFVEGPSCAGKSTAVDTIFKNNKNTFRISKDTIKRLISDYSSDNASQRQMLEIMLQNMCITALENGMLLIIETQKQLVDNILEYSTNNEVELKYINIEAPLDILKERFTERKIKLSKKGITLNYSYDDLLMDIYNDYHANKFTDGITLDTSMLSEKEVVSKIEEYLGC